MEPTGHTRLVVVGGAPGSGKSTITKRLARELQIPRLGSDMLGRSIAGAKAKKNVAIDETYWLAYELLFHLCSDFLATGLSVIVDITLGWEFQWKELEHILDHHPETHFIPIILQCSKESCLKRIHERHMQRPDYYDPPEYFQKDAKALAVWDYLDNMQPVKITRIDAENSLEDVYRAVKEAIFKQA